MKSKITAIALLAMFMAVITIVILPSCEKLKEATTLKVNFNLPEGYFSLDSTSLLKSEKTLFSQTVNVNIDSIAGANSGMLKEVHFNKLRFSIVSPEWVRFDWLSSARATITPEGGSPIPFAASAIINQDDRYIDFQLVDVNILSSLKGKFTITIYGTMNDYFPATTVDVLTDSGIEITISPLG